MILRIGPGTSEGYIIRDCEKLPEGLIVDY